nr:DUF1284 domain-containing protein [Jannaschia sp. S6380]
MTLRLRRHHILCSIGFEGVGYSDAFTANMGHIVHGQLRAADGEAVSIRITDTADSICAPCPKRRGLGCEGQDLIDRLDAAHGAALDVRPGDRLTWGACLDRVRARIVPGDLDRICEGCSWLEGGMCKRAVAKLLAGRKKAAPEGTA